MIDLDKLEARLKICVVIHLVGPNCNMSCEPETILSLISSLKSSRAENERLRLALEFYANGHGTDVICDDGKKARQALATEETK
jgi:hypothetical protein